MTKQGAVRYWVRGLNAIPTRMIAKLWECEPEDWQEVTCAEDSCADSEDVLPMWGTMWSFGDDYWLEEQGGLRVMSQCGFRIYKSEEFGYFFGIDGVGYDFYEAHWMPLYEARGVKWHDE